SLSGNVGQSLGYSADELIGEPFATIVASKDNSLINEIISWAKDKKNGIDGLEIRLVSKSGSVNRFLLGARVFFDSGGNLMRIHGILRDIEQVKKASGQEIFYSEMLEDLSDAVWGSDEGGYIRYWNKSAEKLLMYQKGEILGKDAHVLFPPEKEWELSWALGGKGFAKSFESQRAKKDGGAVDFRVASKLVKDATGNTIGYVEILKDVELERKLREAEKAKKKLDEDYKQLRRDNQLGADFVSSVSHEIRTPLTNIHGYSLLIQEESGKLSPEHKKYIDIIASETDRLRRLVNEVLDISKLDSFRFKPDMQEMHLNSLQEKCSCTYLAEGKGIYVNWEFEEGLPPAYADPIRISQVLINLISNAIKFTEKGGITVLAYRKKRSFIQVDVTDTGEGIPLDEQKNIFKRFHQASAGKKREGTGLGLAIAEQIVKVHGGRLWLESSKIGEGSTFSFTLPTKKRQPRAAKKKQPQISQQMKAEQVQQQKIDAPAEQKEQLPATESLTKEKAELPASETEGQKQ
ncbi:MAG: PAS domain-containing sensor histidine kinase, partial [Candidatus Micrarchaeota archaeon]